MRNLQARTCRCPYRREGKPEEAIANWTSTLGNQLNLVLQGVARPSDLESDPILGLGRAERRTLWNAAVR